MKLLIKLCCGLAVVSFFIVRGEVDKNNGQAQRAFNEMQRQANDYAAEKTTEFCKASPEKCIAAGVALTRIVAGK